MPDANLVVIYGPPLVGKSSLAWELARRMSGKTAVVSGDGLLGGAIAVPDPDPLAELDMVTIQLRLMVANYLKNRYHVVLEAPFYYERDGRLLSAESDVTGLIALMRQLTRQALIVRLDAPEEVLRQRAQVAGREAELPAILRLKAAYKERQDERFVRFDTSVSSVGEMASELLDRLK
jgi:hypothetical protein